MVKGISLRAVVRVSAAITLFLTSFALYGQNVIQLENAKAGNSNWVIHRPGTVGHYIEGYASSPGIERGGQVTFYVSTLATHYTYEVYRMGWYGGAGARLVVRAKDMVGHTQPITTPNATTGLNEANWKPSFSLSLTASSDPTVWCSGQYLVKLVTQGARQKGYEAYIPFVITENSRHSDILFESPVTTSQAYNNWGGKALYANISTNSVPARKVSFERPYVNNAGGGPFFVFEYPLIRFLEREGYDVTYATSIDLHETPQNNVLHKLLISAGHDEYWTYQMRGGVEAARDRGLSVAFLGADASNEQIRLEPSLTTGRPDQTVVAYKDFWKTEDPYALDSDVTNDKLIATDYVNLKRPSDSMVGTSFFAAYPSFSDTDVLLTDTSSFLFTNTGLTAGDLVSGILGTEVDRLIPRYAPTNIHEIARSPVHLLDGRTLYSSMTWYAPTPNSFVFSAGTLRYAIALDDYNLNNGPSKVNPGIQQMMRNLIKAATGH